MSSTLIPTESQNYDIASLQSRLQALESTQHSLKSQLSDLRRRHESQLQEAIGRNVDNNDIPGGIAASDAEILSQTFTNSKALQDLQVENLYRLVGITTFTVKDPNPVYRSGKKEGRKLIGVRIESFSEGKFLAPYYLLLTPQTIQKNNEKSAENEEKHTSLSIIHHTIPSFMNLSILINKYLPSGLPIEKQNLQKLVEELRRIIVLYHRRLDILESARKMFLEDVTEDVQESNDERLGNVTSISSDNAARLVEVEWEVNREVNRKGRKVVAYLMLEEEGGVKKAVVKEYKQEAGSRKENDKDKERKRRDKRRERYRDLEWGFVENGLLEGIVLASRGL